jgi:hypothetical protein
MVLLGVGSVLGLLAAVFPSRLLEQIVYQANPSDPAVVGGAVLTMALLGIAGSPFQPGERLPSIHPNSCGKSEASHSSRSYAQFRTVCPQHSNLSVSWRKQGSALTETQPFWPSLP